MGMAYGFECKKCKYKFSVSMGIGFMFPVVYQKTIKDVKAGEYGELGKMFFEMYPEGTMDVEETAFRCKDCGKYMSAPRLSMHIPKEGYQHEKPTGIWSVSMPWKGADYISHMEIEEYYDCIGEYDHKCECGGDFEVVPHKFFAEDEVVCPKCKNEMECYLQHSQVNGHAF